MSSYLLVIMNRQIVHCLCIDKEVGKLLLENVYERKIIDIMSLEKQIKNEIIINMSVSDINILQSSKMLFYNEILCFYRCSEPQKISNNNSENLFTVKIISTCQKFSGVQINS